MSIPPRIARSCFRDSEPHSQVFHFVPSILAPGRTEGKSPLDMHRLCGLISGRGQGGRERRDRVERGMKVEQAATMKWLE